MCGQRRKGKKAEELEIDRKSKRCGEEHGWGVKKIVRKRAL